MILSPENDHRSFPLRESCSVSQLSSPPSRCWLVVWKMALRRGLCLSPGNPGLCCYLAKGALQVWFRRDLEMGWVSCIMLADPISSHEALQWTPFLGEESESDNQRIRRDSKWKGLNPRRLAWKEDKVGHKLRNTGTSKCWQRLSVDNQLARGNLSPAPQGTELCQHLEAARQEIIQSPEKEQPCWQFDISHGIPMADFRPAEPWDYKLVLF